MPAPPGVSAQRKSGGGRCNLTNSFEGVSRLEEAYPRGAAVVKNAFKALSPEQTFQWWENAGVALTVQPDGCVFPESQDAMQVVRTLERLMRVSGVELRCGQRVSRIRPGFLLDIEGSDEPFRADAVLLAAGGLKEEALRQLLPPQVSITPTVPSLFTLKVPDPGLNALMGTLGPRRPLGTRRERHFRPRHPACHRLGRERPRNAQAELLRCA